MAWASQDVGATVAPMTADEWKELLERAELREIFLRTEAIGMQDETRGIIRRYGYRGMFRTLWRALRLYLRNPAYRSFDQGIRNSGLKPQNLEQYFGYGLYVGRK